MSVIWKTLTFSPLIEHKHHYTHSAHNKEPCKHFNSSSPLKRKRKIKTKIWVVRYSCNSRYSMHSQWKNHNKKTNTKCPRATTTVCDHSTPVIALFVSLSLRHPSHSFLQAWHQWWGESAEILYLSESINTLIE